MTNGLGVLIKHCATAYALESYFTDMSPLFPISH